MNRASFDVFLYGTVFLDLVLTGLRGRPSPGTEVFTDGMGSCPGGIANLAVAASRLGLATSLSAAFGDDVYGDFCWQVLTDEGVDLSHARRMPGWPTPLTVSLAYNDDRAMVTHMRATPLDEDALVGTPPPSRAAIVYLSPEPPAWRDLAREQGTLVFADVGWDGSEQWSSTVLDQLSGCHAFLPNQVEAMAYTRTDDAEAALRRLADLVPVVAVTSGSGGSRAIDSLTGEHAWAGPVPVSAQDATGAGDVFDTAFALGTLNGWPLGDRLAFANLCAALSVQHIGGSLAAPGWGDITDWWSGIRARAATGGPASEDLARRYGFLDGVIPDGALRTVRRAETTLARNADEADGMSTAYRHVVLGAGVIGSAAALRLAERADGDVLVLEQYRLGHDLGSSNDHSRIIRHAYHSAAYTALTRSAYASWEDVERRTGLELVLRTGGLDLFQGAPGDEDLLAYRSALDTAAIPYELLENSAIRARYPQWRIDDDMHGMFQPDGGILNIRRAVAAQVALARELGVTFAEQTRVERIDRDGERIAVHTYRGIVWADRLTLATGSWAGELLPDLGVRWPITLTREQVSYFTPSNLRAFAPDRFPIWVYHGEDIHYGFPVYGEVAVKLARDLGKNLIAPDERTTEPDPEETERLRGFLARHLPDAVGPELLSKVCIYDMPPDKEFIVDLLPGDPRITVAIGGSGHAGKFGALLGEVVAELATTNTTRFPVDIFRADRPALSDPRFPATTRLSAAR